MAISFSKNSFLLNKYNGKYTAIYIAGITNKLSAIPIKIISLQGKSKYTIYNKSIENKLIRKLPRQVIKKEDISFIIF
jgi:hypothetical protein